MVCVGDVLDCLDNVTMRGKHPDEVQQTKLSNSRSVLLLTREGQPLPPVTLVYAHARLGIGIHVKRDSSTNLIQVAHIQTNSPADRSGLIHVGDVIDAVHYRPESRLAFRVTHVTGMHPEDVHDLLKVQRDHHITLFMNRNRWDPMNRAQDIKYTVRLQQILVQNVPEFVQMVQSNALTCWRKSATCRTVSAAAGSAALRAKS